MLTNNSETTLRPSPGMETGAPRDRAPGQPRTFSRRLIKILTVMERFRMEAEHKGHAPFAEALRSCTLEISGGNMDCPLGKLVVDESARTGVFMAFNASAPPPQPRNPARGEGGPPPTGLPPATVLEWQSKYARLWNLLKDDARLANDTDCLEALEACNDLTQNHRCPVRELIVRSMWHGDKS